MVDNFLIATYTLSGLSFGVLLVVMLVYGAHHWSENRVEGAGIYLTVTAAVFLLSHFVGMLRSVRREGKADEQIP